MEHRTLVEAFFETEMVKYQKRVEKIRVHPDPGRAKANAILYEALAERSKKQLEGYRSGRPVAFAGLNLTNILEAMGFVVIDLFFFAQRQAGPRGDEYRNIAEKAGYRPRSLCDIVLTEIAMVMSGDLGIPAFFAGSNASCDVASVANLAIGHYLKREYRVPYFHVDCYEEGKIAPLEYISKQFEELIDFAESNVPAVKFCESKLLEVQENFRWCQDILNEIWHFSETIPSPIASYEAFRVPEISLANTPKGREYFEAYLNEVKERIANGFSAVAQEKGRVLWCVSAPFFGHPFRVLEEKGISIPAVIMDLSEYYWGDGDGKLDWVRAGRKLSPLEQEAEMLLKPKWAGPAEGWIRDVVNYACLFKVDGIVYFLQPGCKTTVATGQLVKERVQKELGLPFLFLEGHQIFQRDHDAKSIDERLAEFADMILRGKSHY